MLVHEQYCKISTINEMNEKLQELKDKTINANLKHIFSCWNIFLRKKLIAEKEKKTINMLYILKRHVKNIDKYKLNFNIILKEDEIKNPIKNGQKVTVKENQKLQLICEVDYILPNQIVKFKSLEDQNGIDITADFKWNFKKEKFIFFKSLEPGNIKITNGKNFEFQIINEDNKECIQKKIFKIIIVTSTKFKMAKLIFYISDTPQSYKDLLKEKKVSIPDDSDIDIELNISGSDVNIIKSCKIIFGEVGGKKESIIGNVTNFEGKIKIIKSKFQAGKQYTLNIIATRKDGREIHIPNEIKIKVLPKPKIIYFKCIDPSTNAVIDMDDLRNKPRKFKYKWDIKNAEKIKLTTNIGKNVDVSKRNEFEEYIKKPPNIKLTARDKFGRPISEDIMFPIIKKLNIKPHVALYNKKTKIKTNHKIFNLDNKDKLYLKDGPQGKKREINKERPDFHNYSLKKDTPFELIAKNNYGTVKKSLNVKIVYDPVYLDTYNLELILHWKIGKDLRKKMYILKYLRKLNIKFDGSKSSLFYEKQMKEKIENLILSYNDLGEYIKSNKYLPENLVLLYQEVFWKRAKKIEYNLDIIEPSKNIINKKEKTFKNLLLILNKTKKEKKNYKNRKEIINDYKEIKDYLNYFYLDELIDEVKDKVKKVVEQWYNKIEKKDKNWIFFKADVVSSKSGIEWLINIIKNRINKDKILKGIIIDYKDLEYFCLLYRENVEQIYYLFFKVERIITSYNFQLVIKSKEIYPDSNEVTIQIAEIFYDVLFHAEIDMSFKYSELCVINVNESLADQLKNIGYEVYTLPQEPHISILPQQEPIQPQTPFIEEPSPELKELLEHLEESVENIPSIIKTYLNACLLPNGLIDNTGNKIIDLKTFFLFNNLFEENNFTENDNVTKITIKTSNYLYKFEININHIICNIDNLNNL